MNTETDTDRAIKATRSIIVKEIARIKDMNSTGQTMLTTLRATLHNLDVIEKS